MQFIIIVLGYFFKIIIKPVSYIDYSWLW